MAPTKSVGTVLPKKVVQKRLTRAKPLKPPLKTPTRITVNIANSGGKPPRIARKVTTQRKFELANEVALEQLSKSSHPSTKALPLPVSPVLIKTEPGISTEVAKIKPTPKRKRNTTPKSAPEEPSSDNMEQSKKTMKLCIETAAKPKLKRKQALKCSESEEFKSLAKTKSVNNVMCESEPELLPVIRKKPGPKSRTMNEPLANRKIAKPETSEHDTSTELKKKMKPSKKGPGRAQKQTVIPNFSDGHSNCESVEQEVINKTPAKRVYKRKQTPKKPESEAKGTKKFPAGTATKTPRGRTRAKFVSERLNGNKLKITKANKGKIMNAKEIKVAASMLDNALGIHARQVKTRSNSVNSTNSQMSWTRDISTASSMTSSTTTCVTVSTSDFVRFDKKLPFVQVEQTNLDRLKVIEEAIDNNVLDNDSSSSDSDSDSSESSSDSELEGESKPELNLSTSSLTVKSPQSEGTLDNTELLSLEMDKLTNSLRNFYTDMNKWMVCDDDDTSFSPVLDVMDLENDLIANCENFTRMLDTLKSVTNASPENRDPEACRSTQVEMSVKDYEDTPGPSRMSFEDTGRNDSDDESSCVNQPPSVKGRYKFPVSFPVKDNTQEKNSPAKSIGSSETFTSDNYNYMSFDDRVCDDEDALSLYAESITGIESSRLSSASNMSVQEPQVPKPTPLLQEAYVPVPTRPWLLDKYTYRPTRISGELPKRTEDVPLKIIEPNMIEKQNADSSSISKETDLSKKALDLLEDANRLSSLAEDSVKAAEQNKPQRMFAHYQAVIAVKSALYRGNCFFHLAKQCKNTSNCRFPHTDIDVNVAKCRLTVLSEDNLIEEYLLTVKFNNLRRNYGLLFMQECKRRVSTRILMEMAIDLGLGVLEWEDNNLRLNALEITLLHLNNISFDACDDLLTYEHNDTMLCDALVLCMAHSQNFAQFKKAFVKLANFMAQIKRPVDIEVVGNILERVCILPCEDTLARGMLSLMKNTNDRIFENALAKSFEVQLSNIESDVHDAYLMAKKAALEAQLGQAELSPVPRVGSEGSRHPSPDTTNLDSLKKAQMAQPTTFKRTIDTEAIRHLFKSPANPAPKRYAVPREEQWRRAVGYTGRPRGRPHLTRMPIGRRVYRTPTNQRNGTNS